MLSTFIAAVEELADSIAQSAIVMEVVFARALADQAYNVDLLQETLDKRIHFRLRDLVLNDDLLLHDDILLHDDLVIVIYYLKILLSFGPPAIISGRKRLPGLSDLWNP